MQEWLSGVSPCVLTITSYMSPVMYCKPWKFISANKSHVRETSLFTSTISKSSMQ